MSFGVSPSDIKVLVASCKTVYRRCRGAGGYYDEISYEVKALHSVLRHLKYEAEASESPLNRDRSIWGQQVAPIASDCEASLRQLDNLLEKHGRLSADSDGSPTQKVVSWDKAQLGRDELDQLGTIRVKLISHKKNLTLFMDKIQLDQSGLMPTTLENDEGQLDIILDKVDSIAARMGPTLGSAMGSYNDNDIAVWKQFRRELVTEGFSSDVLEQHKDVLRAYIRELDQNGLLDEAPPTRDPPSTEGVASGKSHVSKPARPPLGSPKVSVSGKTAKEMAVQEDNTKYPLSMKLQRFQPETNRYMDYAQQSGVSWPELPESREISGTNQREPTPGLELATVGVRGAQNYDKTRASDSDSDSNRLMKLFEDPSKVVVISTFDLLGLSQMLRSWPPGLPRSFDSSMSLNNNAMGSRIEYSPKEHTNPSISPSQVGPLAIPTVKTNISRNDLDTNIRPEPQRLAPDSQGNDIPSHAKWTKINRRLVSPEVLDQDGRRYEARPDFVAVLGVLSLGEIEEYAVRSHALRAARTQPKHPPPPVRRPVPRSPSERNENGPPSTDEEDSSDEEHYTTRRNKRRGHSPPSDAGSDLETSSGYPNPFGVRPPSPPRHLPASTAAQPIWVPRSAHYQNAEDRNNPSNSYEVDQGKGSPTRSSSLARDNKEHSHHRRHGSSSRHSSRSNNRGSRDRETERKGSGWRDSVKAAGLGGAAMGLLSVLSEAAGGL